MGRNAARTACLLLALACACSGAAGGGSAPSLEAIPIDSRTRRLLVGMATGRSLAEQAAQPALVISNSASYPGIVAAAALDSCGGRYGLTLNLPPQFAGLYRARVRARGVAVAPPANMAASFTQSAGEQGRCWVSGCLQRKYLRPLLGCCRTHGWPTAAAAPAPAPPRRRPLCRPCPGRQAR